MRKGIAGFSGLLAAILLAATTAYAGDTVYYYYNDAQGSPVAVADAQGNIVERTDYAPYGATLNRPVHDGPGYTGHEEDSATGLTYMQQRYYDSQSGQFISADPMLPDGNTGTSFNRYLYANNNPYRYTDPDGRQQYDDNAAELENRWSDSSVAAGEVQAGQTALGATADAADWVNTNFVMPAGPAGAEIDVAVAPLIGVLREAAAVAKTAEAAGDAAKISGAAQVTRAAGKETMHAATSERIAAEQAARSDVKSVHLNQTISTATKGEVKSSLRPDVQAVRTDGKVEAHEVLSPGQDAAASAAKYNNALGDKAASIKCVPQDKC